MSNKKYAKRIKSGYQSMKKSNSMTWSVGKNEFVTAIRVPLFAMSESNMKLFGGMYEHCSTYFKTNHYETRTDFENNAEKICTYIIRVYMFMCDKLHYNILDKKTISETLEIFDDGYNYIKNSSTLKQQFNLTYIDFITQAFYYLYNGDIEITKKTA